jgi:hypothetical protein
MSPAPARHRHRRIVLVLLVALPLVAAIGWFSLRKEQRSGFDDALDRAILPVMEQHEVALKLGAATPTQARLLAREVAANSIQFLAPADLELWAATRLRVARAAPADCAKLWKGGDAAFWGEAVAKLGDDALHQYAEMLARGLAIRLERKPPPEPSVGAIVRGMDAIAEQLPVAQRAAFKADLARNDLSDARACELFMLVSTGTEKLAPPQRIDFLRGLAKALPTTNEP